MKANTKKYAANGGYERSEDIQLKDSFAGILAEFATLDFLNRNYPQSAKRPIVTNIKNQIDIEWDYRNEKVYIEVRSSFVKNGIDFALYAVDNRTGRTFFDIIGPYYQLRYKKDYETTKDLYFRVFFEGDKTRFIDNYISKNAPFYLVGAMSGKDIIMQGIKKTMSSYELNIKKNHGGDYFTAPIDKILDIEEFLNQFHP
ncbi:hypothetical protein BW721_08940 [Jeotgalibaca sp. PTS2502]|uniref:hypothetical protein n=1 Tax=Jeotgalibaca sp. PTS2502 TaxID=1903686 RepID=UPI000973AF1C|nr:hypothetical protein [Jeotgalibaca sp. PTS2502]APZ49750.1 hypothetical protein BW721_08940 [Jeotgalibaca sp. PTS2502]